MAGEDANTTTVARAAWPAEELEVVTRHLDDPSGIVRAAMELLRQRLHADRCAWAEVEDDEDHFVFLGDARAEGVAAASGRFPVSAFGERALRVMREGHPFVVNDVLRDFPQGADASAYTATGIRSMITIPVHIDGRFAAGTGVHMVTARQWTPDEVALAAGVTQHCWSLIRRARVLGALRDREARLDASASALRTLANLTPAIVWACDEAGDAVFINEQWTKYTGQPVEQALGSSWTRFVHPEDRPSVLTQWGVCTREVRALEAEVRYLRSDGVYRWHTVRATPHVVDGKLEKWFGLSVDSHDSRVANEELRDSERRLHQFIAVLAHELRNPLAPIRMATTLLQQTPDLPADVVRFHAVIERQVGQLSHLLNDLLDISRVANGKITLERRGVNLRDVVASALEAVESRLTDHRVEVFHAADTPLVFGDPVRLCQIVTNLLHNASKFTPKAGQVRVSTVRMGNNARLEVADTGIGLSPSEIEQVFTLFSHAGRAPQSGGMGSGGMGIGLWLARSLAELHGGTLSVRSEGDGKGCTFELTLPAHLEVTAADERIRLAARPLDGRVLVVDDNRDAADTTAALLGAWGCRVTVAYDGPTALELATQVDLDVAILDLGMSPMDGYDVCRVLRARHPTLRLVALTGWGDVATRERATAAGFDVHLVKPVTPALLEEAMGQQPRRAANQA